MIFTTFLFNIYRRVLIDAGDPNRPDYIQLLQESLTSIKARLSHIIVTHWHHDHLGGVEAAWKMTGGTLVTIATCIIKII